MEYNNDGKSDGKITRDLSKSYIQMGKTDNDWAKSIERFSKLNTVVDGGRENLPA